MMIPTEAVSYIVTGFNNRCAEDAGYRVRHTAKTLVVRGRMQSIRFKNGVITAQCRKSRPNFEGSHYVMTISDRHFHCSCMAFSTAKRDEWGHKIPCCHLVVVACAAAVHSATRMAA